MAPIGRSKGVSYYFRIELNTIQGKITSGFCFVGILAGFQVILATWLIYPVLEQREYITNVIDASDHQLMLVSATTDRIVTQANLNLLRSEQFSANGLAAITKSVRTPLDSLSRLSKSWKGSESLLSLKLIEVKSESILKGLKALNKIDSPELQAQLVQNELLPLQATIQDQINTIQRIQALEKKATQTFIHSRTDNFSWILASSMITCILIGAAYASYIVMRVLSEIKMLKTKILEISEGKLIDTIPPSRNELNSIIKALNILTENLGNIRDFAAEVGKGNFDTNISVFGGHNDLGEALAGMRDSLKGVAQEEKQRSWVTSGQAHFSELLRNTTTDQTAYYQIIISELVKHLNVNQAALYVLEEQEGCEPVLEMKSSYAYGRLKYQVKTLAPGQGMVGQVFLEKMPLFLNNIPNTFLQIGSGLGEAGANHLVVVPLKINETVNGVLELASFHRLAPFEIEFLLKIAENISGALQNMNNIQTTARLLQEAQDMAQAMQAQEEMLRQNSEELIATQEQLSRDLQETKLRADLIERSIQQSPFAHLIISRNGIIREANTKATELFGQQLQGKMLASLLDEPELLHWIQQAQENITASQTYQHPQIGEMHLRLQAFSAGNQLYFNLLIVPQGSFSPAHQ